MSKLVRLTPSILVLDVFFALQQGEPISDEVRKDAHALIGLAQNFLFSDENGNFVQPSNELRSEIAYVTREFLTR